MVKRKSSEELTTQLSEIAARVRARALYCITFDYDSDAFHALRTELHEACMEASGYIEHAFTGDRDKHTVKTALDAAEHILREVDAFLDCRA